MPMFWPKGMSVISVVDISSRARAEVVDGTVKLASKVRLRGLMMSGVTTVAVGV